MKGSVNEVMKPKKVFKIIFLCSLVIYLIYVILSLYFAIHGISLSFFGQESEPVYGLVSGFTITTLFYIELWYLWVPFLAYQIIYLVACLIRRISSSRSTSE